MTEQTVEAEIVEVVEPTVVRPDIPPPPEMFTVLYPFQFLPKDKVVWSAMSGESVERLLADLKRLSHRVGDHGDLRFYRLGPPKPRMTEAEVEKLAEQFVQKEVAALKYVPWRPSFIRGLVAFARELGVIGEGG